MWVISSKICWEKSSFIKIGLLCVLTNVRFWSYLAMFLKWEMFQTKGVEKITTLFVFGNIRKCDKILYSRAGHRWQYGARALRAGYLSLQVHSQKCNTHRFSTAAIVTRTRLTVTLYLMFIGPCIVAIVDEWKTNLMSLAILFYFTYYALNMFRTLAL